MSFRTSTRADAAKKLLELEEAERKKKNKQLKAKLLKIKLAATAPITPEARRGLVQDTKNSSATVHGSPTHTQNRIRAEVQFINKGKKIRPKAGDASISKDLKERLAKTKIAVESFRQKQLRQRAEDPDNEFNITDTEMAGFDEQFAEGIPEPRVEGFSGNYVDKGITGINNDGKYLTDEIPTNVDVSIAHMKEGTSGLSEKLEDLRVNRTLEKDRGQGETFMEKFTRSFGAPSLNKSPAGKEPRLNDRFSQGVIGRDLAKKLAKTRTANEHGHTILMKGHQKGMFRSASLESQQGRYAKYWLLNAKQTNGNGWGIAAHSAKANMAKFIGRPLVVTSSKWHGASDYGEKYDHPYVPTNDLNKIFEHQEKYRVGNIVDIGEKDGDYFAMVEMLPKFANMTLPPFCSPAIYQLDAKEAEGQISKWEALHLAALDENPAYGARIALLRGMCVGTNNECRVQFRSAKATGNEYGQTEEEIENQHIVIGRPKGNQFGQTEEEIENQHSVIGKRSKSKVAIVCTKNVKAKLALIKSPDKPKVDPEMNHTRVDSNGPLINKVPFGDEDRDTNTQAKDRFIRGLLKNNAASIGDKIRPPIPKQSDRARIIKAKLAELIPIVPKKPFKLHPQSRDIESHTSKRLGISDKFTGSHFLTTDGQILGDGRTEHKDMAHEILTSFPDKEFKRRATEATKFVPAGEYVKMKLNLDHLLEQSGMTRINASRRDMKIQSKHPLTKSQMSTITQHIEDNDVITEDVYVDDDTPNEVVKKQLRLGKLNFRLAKVRLAIDEDVRKKLKKHSDDMTRNIKNAPRPALEKEVPFGNDERDSGDRKVDVFEEYAARNNSKIKNEKIRPKNPTQADRIRIIKAKLAAKLTGDNLKTQKSLDEGFFKSRPSTLKTDPDFVDIHKRMSETTFKYDRKKHLEGLKKKQKVAVKLIRDDEIRALREQIGPDDKFPNDNIKRSPADSRRNFNIQLIGTARKRLFELDKRTRRDNPETPLINEVPFGKERRPKKNSIGQERDNIDAQDSFLALNTDNITNPFSEPPKPRQQDRTRIIKAKLALIRTAGRFDDDERALDDKYESKKKKIDSLVDKIADIAMKERRKKFIEHTRRGRPDLMRNDPTSSLIREVPFGPDTRLIESNEHGNPKNFDYVTGGGRLEFDVFEAEQDKLPKDKQFPTFGDVTGKGKKMMRDNKGNDVDANSFRVIPHGGISIPAEQKRIVRPFEKRNHDIGKLKARSNRNSQMYVDAVSIAGDFFDGKPNKFINKNTNKIRPNKPVRSDYTKIISAKLAILRLKLASQGEQNMTYQNSKKIRIHKRKHPEVRKAKKSVEDILRASGRSVDASHHQSTFLSTIGDYIGGGDIHDMQVRNILNPNGAYGESVTNDFIKKHGLARVQTFPVNRAGEKKTSVHFNSKANKDQLKSVRDLEASGSIIGYAVGSGDDMVTGEGSGNLIKTLRERKLL